MKTSRRTFTRASSIQEKRRIQAGSTQNYDQEKVSAQWKWFLASPGVEKPLFSQTYKTKYKVRGRKRRERSTTRNFLHSFLFSGALVITITAKIITKTYLQIQCLEAMKFVTTTKRSSFLARKRSQKYYKNNCFKELFCNHFGQDGRGSFWTALWNRRLPQKGCIKPSKRLYQTLKNVLSNPHLWFGPLHQGSIEAPWWKALQSHRQGSIYRTFRIEPPLFRLPF